MLEIFIVTWLPLAKKNVVLWVWGPSDTKQSDHEQILAKKRIYSDTGTGYSWHQTAPYSAFNIQIQIALVRHL